MKSRVVVGLFLLLTIAAGTASAQTAIRGNVKVGVNFATITGPVDSGVSKSMRLGGVFGAGVSAVVNSKITFDPEVLFSMEGLKVKAGSDEAKTSLDFVRIPLLFRINTGVGQRTGYLIVGPAIGLVARAKNKLKGGTSEDIKSELKSADLAVVFGAGVQANKLFFEGRYTAGLTNLNKDSDEANRSQVVSVLLGARF